MTMKIQKRRTTAKIQLHCHTCKVLCSPKDGDWHDGEQNQIFLCVACSGKKPILGRTRLQSVLGHVSA